MEIFQLATGLEEVIELIIVETNLYAQKKGRKFLLVTMN